MGNIIYHDFGGGAMPKEDRGASGDLRPELASDADLAIAAKALEMKVFLTSLRGGRGSAESTGTLDRLVRTYPIEQVRSLIAGSEESSWAERPTFWKFVLNRFISHVSKLG
jgi:hypothetical protein